MERYIAKPDPIFPGLWAIYDTLAMGWRPSGTQTEAEEGARLLNEENDR